jgi:hypothetical protein
MQSVLSRMLQDAFDVGGVFRLQLRRHMPSSAWTAVVKLLQRLCAQAGSLTKIYIKFTNLAVVRRRLDGFLACAAAADAGLPSRNARAPFMDGGCGVKCRACLQHGLHELYALNVVHCRQIFNPPCHHGKAAKSIHKAQMCTDRRMGP